LQTNAPSPLTASALVPSEGSQVGRYQLLREIAKGPLGPLYEVRTVDGSSQLGGLGRLLLLPSDLPAEAESIFSEAAWESMELRYDLALCVADVVFGKGWITLVHDHSEGSLLRGLLRRASERQSAFPVAVALRVALDLAQGIEQYRAACAAAGITLRSGGLALSSLYLCGDGRTRALDGQVANALPQVPQIRRQISSQQFPAPELLENDAPADERADVFSVGAVLWQLLTGRELVLGEAVALGQRPRPKVPNLNLSIPKGNSLPIELVKVVHAALEFEPSNRPATTKELVAAIVAAGEVASYPKVIDFTDALLNRESTLFRLTLDAGPKLSDESPSERPKPNHLEWAAELAKHARVAEAQRPAKAVPTSVARSPQMTTPPAKPRVTTPASPAASLPNERKALGPSETAAAPSAKNSLAKKTLMGISAGALETATGTSSDVVASDVSKTASKLDGKKTLVGLAVPRVTSPPGRALTDNFASAPVMASRATESTARPAPSTRPETPVARSEPLVSEGASAARAEPITNLIARALPVAAGNLPAAPAQSAAGHASPLSLDSAFMPIAAATVTAERPVTTAPSGRRVFALTWPTLILGLSVNTVLAVSVTLLVQRALPTTPVSTSTTTGALNIRTNSTAINPVSELPPVVVVPAVPTTPTAVAEKVPAATASAGLQTAPAVTEPITQSAKAPGATPGPAAFTPAAATFTLKPAPRKRRGQYVPNEL